MPELATQAECEVFITFYQAGLTLPEVVSLLCLIGACREVIS